MQNVFFAVLTNDKNKILSSSRFELCLRSGVQLTYKLTCSDRYYRSTVRIKPLNS